MRRNPHNKEAPKASDIIEIIHSDIRGTVNKCKWLQIYPSNYCRKSQIFLLKRKSEAIDIVINTLKFLSNQNKNNIKIFKSDHGKKFDNIRIKKICIENGISKGYSPPYNPENNGLVEGFN